ncbi:MAG: Molybdopterin molybdenumtransferase, partial [Verrucomicrobiota bacterium]
MNFTTANFNPPASADDVWALLAKNSVPLAAARVSLADAAGRILREDVCAPEDQPAFDRSSVDGFAVRLDDAAESFCVVDEIRAGDWKPRTLQPGEAVRLATGGALPSDGLQVVMKEDVTLDGSTLHVTRRSRATNIRVRGEDARREQVLLSAGAELSPGALALLASVGAAQPLVTRLPRVLHLATGNEIVAPDQTPARGQIRDSNSTLVRAFVRHWNAALVQQRLPEDESAVRAVLGSFFEKPAALPLPSPLPLGEGTDSRALKNSDATRASDATELAKTRQTHLPLPA